MNYKDIKLEPEQQDLFIEIVEKVKKIPRNDRMNMFNIKTVGGGGWLNIPSRNSGTYEIKDFVDGDLEELSRKNLLRISYDNRSNKNFVVSPEGFKYYEWLIKQQGKPVERIEKQIFRYLEFEEFKKQYQVAYRKLKEAEEKLWSADKEEHFTTIGHLCRELMQEFADRLYTNVLGKSSSDPKPSTVKRLREIIEIEGAEKGETVKPFLEALLAYWGTLSDLVQRQEHGGQKEGEPVNWEDSRRIVFQTTNLMFELHKTFNSNK